MRKLISLLLALSLCASGLSMAEEEMAWMTGVIVEVDNDSLAISWEDGNIYVFSLTGSEDLSQLTGNLTPGRAISVHYSGQIDWENADCSGAEVVFFSEDALGYPYAIVSEEESAQLDLNQDGAMEALSFSWQNGEYDDSYALLQIDQAQFPSEITSRPQALVCDLDGEDGRLDILLSGDVMSDDFVTWRLQYDGSQIIDTGDVLWGAAVDFIDGYVIVQSWVDTLGTYGAETYCSLDESGRLCIPEDSEWVVLAADEDAWEYYTLTLIADLPVILFTDDGEEETSLPAGTKLHITATNLCSEAYFETTDGQLGCIQISPSQRGWGMDIAGQSEDTYFEFLPYSG